MLRVKHSRPLLLLLFTCLCISGCQGNESANRYTKPENYITHDNSRFNFSVDFPDAWEYTLDGMENYKPEDTGLPEELPQAGVEIIFDNDPEQRIFVYGQNGTITWDARENTVVEEIVTGSGLKGKSYTDLSDNNLDIYFVFDDNNFPGYRSRSVGGIIRMNKDVYDRNKDDIELMMKSIRIINKGS
ncbi:hypothetical protein [Paenibacillus tengchongensis]|uniref:hypothetical protein n=1 Tax=Paenibacillus tengchongensis TaxID=2608684 RepID=UPI00124CE8F7|nr:hypothetical protein [Paenibacillus tengchongensis]